MDLAALPSFEFRHHTRQILLRVDIRHPNADHLLERDVGDDVRMPPEPVPLELHGLEGSSDAHYMRGLAEEPDTEPHEKQKAFAIAARSYAAHYMDDGNRPGSTSLGTTTGYKKFPGMPYDGSDDPAVFQAYEGLTFAEKNPDWVRAVRETAGKVLTKNEDILRAAYFSSDDGRTRSPAEAGWTDFPHAEAFGSKPDPWCRGLPNAGHGVGMSGCGARGQAEEWKSAEEILRYYYPGTVIQERGTGN